MSTSLDYRTIHAAAMDAGNRSMRRAGRTTWNEEDYNASAAEFNRLDPPPDTKRAG